MNHLTKILGGIGILIAIYLVLSNGSQSIKIVESISSNALNGIQVLQGRNKLITNG